uniref:Endonuclease, Uma2 family (Restriction endonuclease fold) n=1 Tax=Candidatus Kentrum sp. FM TaxID=2126340 RepID=A0A450WY86_9GAMM|nr:MAG: Endonuclease, Uma2 family (restriction endonuclease fold) [Candidatus Kentron sp. FM]VFK21986.1 MAG: Endonuclease, Uma2 family (restriction endonuclease fold) [Candidatus Kentron sp. FM]
MTQQYRHPSRGPFTADRIKEADRFELSDGQRIYCAPAGDRHSRHNLSGGSLLDSDPAVEWAGVDAGFTPKPNTLRAPDVSVAPPPAEEGTWIPGVPPLAVEYVDRGQDKPDLEIKIRELLAAGTRYVWVVYLIGPYRVEVHTPDAPVRLLSATDTLEAPGILRNPIPVQALFDRKLAHRVTLRNLLQREGYEDLEAVLREGVQRGKAEGKAEGELAAQVKMLLSALAVRGIPVDTETRARIRDCRDPKQLDAWFMKAMVADGLEEVF